MAMAEHAKLPAWFSRRGMKGVRGLGRGLMDSGAFAVDILISQAVMTACC